MEHVVYEGPLLKKQRLLDIADTYRVEYMNNDPFPHVVLDNVLDQDLIDRIIAEFPAPADIPWNQKVHEYSKKLSCEDTAMMGQWTRLLLYEMNGGVFVRFLERLTGIDSLLPDPHLKGGGMHQIEKGGFLEVHADFNFHEKLQLHRRLNVLLYLNHEWVEEYGGQLELWDAGLQRCVKKVVPVANRMVIFNTTDTSYHGHPVPVSSPDTVARKSLALYYYTTARPADELSPSHSTMYRTEVVSERTGMGTWLKKSLASYLGR